MRRLSKTRLSRLGVVAIWLRYRACVHEMGREGGQTSKVDVLVVVSQRKPDVFEEIMEVRRCLGRMSEASSGVGRVEECGVAVKDQENGGWEGGLDRRDISNGLPEGTGQRQASYGVEEKALIRDRGIANTGPPFPTPFREL